MKELGKGDQFSTINKNNVFLQPIPLAVVGVKCTYITLCY